MALYGVVLLMAAIAYFILTRVLLALHGRDSVLAVALGSDFKGKISVVIYVIAIPLAFVSTWIWAVCMSWWRSCGSSRTGESNGPWLAEPSKPGGADYNCISVEIPLTPAINR